MYEVVWLARNIPALTYLVFTVTKFDQRVHSRKAIASSLPALVPPPPLELAPQAQAASSAPLADIVLENDLVKAVFTATGDLTSITDKVTGVAVKVKAELLFYSSEAKHENAWCVVCCLC